MTVMSHDISVGVCICLVNEMLNFTLFCLAVF